jgi:hypothetical protein
MLDDPYPLDIINTIYVAISAIRLANIYIISISSEFLKKYIISSKIDAVADLEQKISALFAALNIPYI